MTEEPKLVAGRLAVAGLALAVVGLWRRSPLLVFAGGVAIGGGLKLVPPRA